MRASPLAHLPPGPLSPQVWLSLQSKLVTRDGSAWLSLRGIIACKVAVLDCTPRWSAVTGMQSESAMPVRPGHIQAEFWGRCILLCSTLAVSSSHVGIRVVLVIQPCSQSLYPHCASRTCICSNHAPQHASDALQALRRRVQRLFTRAGTSTQPVFGLRARRTDSLPVQESAPAPAAAPAAPQSRCSILAVVHELRLRLRLMQLLIAISFVDARVGLGHAHRLHTCWVLRLYGIKDATWNCFGTLLPPLGTSSICNEAAFCIAPALNIHKGSESI